MSRVRVRQHVNPFAKRYLRPVRIPDWQKVYADLSRPLHLDIGCARGRFVLQMAQQHSESNFLGLEIREPLVEDANVRRDELGLDNLHYLFCHANQSLEAILASLPPGYLAATYIQFPDPWFKKRHVKRRVVQPELVAAIARYLRPLGTVFLQSDVLAIATEMRDRFAEHPAFVPASSGWLPENPLPVATEREVATYAKGEPVYRTLFERI